MQGQFTISNIEKKESKGGEYLSLTLLNDKKEKFKGMLWSDALKKHDINMFKLNAVLNIVESIHNKTYDNYDIRQVELIKEGSIGLTEERRLEIYSHLVSQVEIIEDEALRDWTLKTLKKSRSTLLTSVAAKSKHHAYIGGLLQHTSEVLEASLSLYSYLASINKQANLDFVISGAILHDIFKIKEYNTDLETGTGSINKEWVEVNKNHLRFGWYWAMKNDQKEVAHIIESHHGLKEWDAEQEPHSTEAWIVHLADMASSKMGHIDLTEL